MSRRLPLLAALAIAAASCGGSGDATVIERQVTADEIIAPELTVCDEVEAFAYGSHATATIEQVVDHLARLGAILGASEALPHLADMQIALAEDEQTARALDAAAEILDRVSHAECGIPVFTAMYVTTSYASCFGRAPIAAGTMVPDSTGCENDLAPEFLPCFDETAGFVPVDCRTGDPVVLRDRAWVAA